MAMMISLQKTIIRIIETKSLLNFRENKNYRTFRISIEIRARTGQDPEQEYTGFLCMIFTGLR